MSFSKLLGRGTNGKIKLLIWQTIVLVGIQLLSSLAPEMLLHLGIRPRQLMSLPCIFTAPFIHGSWFHLLGNISVLPVMSGLCLLRGIPYYLRASAFIITLTGLLVWLFGRDSIHIGASGWIFGLWSLAIAQAWFERRLSNIAIALFVIFFYGGMIFGLLPSMLSISFESHIFGVLSGILYAYLISGRKR